MPTYSYNLTEHDPVKPWIIIGVRRRMTIELEDGHSFFEWTQENWPRDPYTVEIDPYQL